MICFGAPSLSNARSKKSSHAINRNGYDTILYQRVVSRDKALLRFEMQSEICIGIWHQTITSILVCYVQAPQRIGSKKSLAADIIDRANNPDTSVVWCFV